jgi:ATP-dependent helicase/DNAse subunit B
MPLKLVTGPANAAKAGRVLEGYRAALPVDPVLVVPRFEDVTHYRRELAADGVIFGGGVLRFAWLWREIARRAGHGARRAGSLEQERAVRAAIARAGPRSLEQSAATPGFARAAASLIAELQSALVEPDALGDALDRWAGSVGTRRAYARDVAAIYAEYRHVLDETGAVDAEGFAREALRALESSPEAWGGSPVFLYGFDDLTALELRALEVLAGPVGAQVMVSLTWEDGREAFASRSRTVEAIRALGAAEERLPAQAEHYAEGSRAALHHLERHLFRPGGDGSPRRNLGSAVGLLESGGERNEIELIAAEVLSLLRAGIPHREIAVVFRHPEAYASLVDPVFAAYGIPVTLDRNRGLTHSAFGRSLLGLVRCALGTGTAGDLLAYLRAPGKFAQPQVIDRFEGALRREEVRDAASARRRWEDNHPDLEELDELAAAAGRGLSALCSVTARQADALFTAPHRRRGEPLEATEAIDAAAHVAVSGVLAQLAVVPPLDGVPDPSPDELLRALQELTIPGAPGPGDAVLVAEPRAVRARRFRALVLGGLQETEFPRPSRPEPFLPDEVRRGLAETGLALRDEEARIDDERFLFYAVASRPEDRLVLSYRNSDEEGRPLVRSFFVDEVQALFGSELEDGLRRRPLGDVVWPPEHAPTAAEQQRSLRAAEPPRRPAPIAPVATEEALAELRSVRVMSAGSLEAYAQCPVKWLAEKRLRAEPLGPDGAWLRRGGFAHAVLEGTLRRLKEERGSGRITPESLPDAERLLEQQAHAVRNSYRLGPTATQARATARRLVAHVRRLLRHEAAGGGHLEPDRLELAFGFEPEENDEELLPALALGDGELHVHGRIDRVDVGPTGRAVVRDYKVGRAATEHQEANWEARGQLQVALYMLAVRAGLGRELAGGVYQPLRERGRKLRPRGLLCDLPEIRELVPEVFDEADLRDPEEFEASLRAAEARAVELARRMRAGELTPLPDTCAYRGGCSYPGICRSVAA